MCKLKKAGQNLRGLSIGFNSTDNLSRKGKRIHLYSVRALAYQGREVVESRALAKMYFHPSQFSRSLLENAGMIKRLVSICLEKSWISQGLFFADESGHHEEN